MHKRPFFLLEIVISMVLVGLFSAYFLRSSIHYLYKERSALLELEFDRLRTLRQMEVVSHCWNGVEAYTKKAKYVAGHEEPLTVGFGGKEYFKKCVLRAWNAKSHQNYYDLVLEENGEGRKYHFLVVKDIKKAEGPAMEGPDVKVPLPPPLHQGAG